MTAPLVTDTHGNRYAPVGIEELDEWAWLIARIEEWLLHAGDDTIADYNESTGPCGPSVDDVTYTLGHMVVRMRNLAKGQP